jgi:multidrug efflux pump subunit AcrA (membrane-fusion protein)
MNVALVPTKRYCLPAMAQVESSRPARVIAWLVAILLATLAAVLVLTPWVQNITGNGRVVAVNPNDREQRIAAPVEGRVVEWHVREGTKVKKGDLVVEFSDNDPRILERLTAQREAIVARLDQQKARVASFQQSVIGVQGSRRNALDAGAARVQMAKENVRAAERSLDAAEANEVTTKLNIDRQNQLLKRGLASRRAVELAELDHNRAVADVDRFKAQLTAAISDRLAREAEQMRIETDFKTSIENAQAQLASALADVQNTNAELQRLDSTIARQSQQRITAPRDGTILRLLAQPGSELLKAGESLAILIPEMTDPTVELWVDGNDAPLVQNGSKVRLQFEGWPAIQFAGWPSVAVGTFGGEVLLVDATDNGQGKFRVLVRPDPNEERWPDLGFRQGVRANGWVLLRTVPLYFELWRQFNGFPQGLDPWMVKDGKGDGKSKK